MITGAGQVGTIVLLRRISDIIERLGQKKAASGGGDSGLDGKDGVIREVSQRGKELG